MTMGKIPKAQNILTPSGKKGNLATLKQMQKVARLRSGHPLVRQLAKQIQLGYKIPSHHYEREARAIGDYVQKNVRYIRDADRIEQVHDPVLMIKDIMKGRAQGDCDDISLLIATLLLSIGHRPKFKTVRYRSKMPWRPYNHIYVIAYERNGFNPVKRIPIDAIVKDKPIGFEVPHKSGKEWDI